MSPAGTNLLGIFELVRALKFPMAFPHMQAQVKLRVKKPIYGEDLKAKIIIELDNKVVSQTNTVLKDAKAIKNQCIPINVDFPDLIFGEAGDYFFKFYLNDRLLITRLLQVDLDHEE